MKCQLVVCARLLLLWTLTASVSCAGPEITVSELADGIKLSCGGKNKIISKNGTAVEDFTLEYTDENTGEYSCEGSDDLPDETKIYVKFRTCDSCIELDETSLIGMIVGNVVATIGIGFAVYLVASQTRTGPVTSHKKSSDRQHLVPNEVSGRAPNDFYQPLKGRQKGTYDVLTNRK